MIPLVSHSYSLQLGRGLYPFRGLILTIAILGALINGCAKVGSPPGGPEDKSAPTLLGSSPTAGAIRVGALNEFVAYFSEAIESRGLENQLFISPRPLEFPAIKVRGDKLVLSFADTLAEGQTYVVTLGSGIRDLHGNQLGSSVSVAFSRGESIAGGSVAGFITDNDAPANGVTVGLFRGFLPETFGDMDSLYPDYVTLSGQDGSFALDYLPDDSYFLLAFLDRDRNKLFRYGSERYALTTQEIVVNAAVKKLDTLSGALSNLEARLQESDTSQVIILGATTTSDNLVRVNLSGNISPSVLAGNLERVTLKSVGADSNVDSNVDSSGDAGIDSSVVRASAMREPAGARRAKFEFFFADLSEGEYELALDFSQMYSDGRIAETQTFSPYRHELIADKNLPELLPDTFSRSLAPWEPVVWEVSFSEPVIIDTEAVFVMALGGTEALFSHSTTNPLALVIALLDEPLVGVDYTLEFADGAITDLAENIYVDTVGLVRSTWPRDSLGTLILSIEDQREAPDSIAYSLVFRHLKGGTYRKWAFDPDSITIDLPVGKYILEVISQKYEDVDTALGPGANRRFDGSLYPLRYADSRTFIPDTIEVRARFVNTGTKAIIQ